MSVDAAGYRLQRKVSGMPQIPAANGTEIAI
jgi:hypothetical protein